jgi:type I restriction enzyme S subunit
MSNDISIKKLLEGVDVEWKSLKACALIKRGQRVTKSQLSIDNKYPVYSGGVTPMGYFEKFNQDANTITITKYGTAGFVNFITEQFWANDVCYCIKPNEKLNNKYLFYFLKNSQNFIQSQATDAIPAHLPTEVISNIPIPIPSLDIQSKIVQILDNFTELTAELTAELTDRKKQYEYYRNKLLIFKDGEVEWKKLGEVVELKKGKQLNKKFLSENGKYPAYNGGVSYSGFTDKCNYEKDTIIISQGGASAGFVNFVTTKFYANAHCYVVLPNLSIVENRYVYHFLKLNQEKLMNKQHGAGIPALKTSEVLDIKIPIPPLEEQQKIVAILDKFDTLTNSISEGLPKEIELREKQYEYYRDLLLTFPKQDIKE